MKPYKTIICLLMISCSFTSETQDISIADLRKKYTDLNDITFSIRSNTNKRIYFHFEGWCYFSLKGSTWIPFDNDLLSKTESNQESNLWLESKSSLDFRLDSKQFLKKFETIPDSFKIKIVYRYQNEDERPKYVFSNSFIVGR